MVGRGPQALPHDTTLPNEDFALDGEGKNHTQASLKGKKRISQNRLSRPLKGFTARAITMHKGRETLTRALLYSRIVHTDINIFVCLALADTAMELFWGLHAISALGAADATRAAGLVKG